MQHALKGGSLQGGAGEAEVFIALGDAQVQHIVGRRPPSELGEIVAPRNPMDVTPLLDDEGNAAIFGAILEDPGVDAGVFGCVPLTQALQTLPPGGSHGEDLEREGGIVDRLGRLRRASANRRGSRIV